MMGKTAERPMARKRQERIQRYCGVRKIGLVTAMIVAPPKIEIMAMYMIWNVLKQ